MGGALLKIWNLPEKRINREEYKKLQFDLCSTFHGYYPTCGFRVPPSLKLKETYGDLDAITTLDGNQIKKIIKEVYKCDKPNCNDNVYSFPVDGFQVDISSVPEKHWYSTYNFMSWGDTSNLIGRLFNFWGANFGHTGLNYTIFGSYFSGKESDVNSLGKIYLSKEMSEILSFIGLDYNKWIVGFNTEEDVFDWIESSKYFTPRPFFFEELNHENRTRNKKRPMYARFVERIAEKYKGQVFPRVAESYYFPRFIQKWPHMLEEIEKLKQSYDEQYIVSHKFNGDIVKTITGREQKALGEFMIAWKAQDNWRSWVLAAKTWEVEDRIKEFNKELCSKQ